MTDKPAKGDSPKEAERPASQDVKQIQDLYQLMVDEGLDTLELKDDKARIRLTRMSATLVSGSVHHAPMARFAPEPRASAAPAAAAGNGAGEKQDAITAPLAGVFYRASSPTTPPFVKEGDTVEPGQTLCIVEAMKVMNEIKAEKRCRILRITAENSRPVTAGQALFTVEPA